MYLKNILIAVTTVLFVGQAIGAVLIAPDPGKLPSISR